MSEGIITHSSEATGNPFDDILKVRGILVQPKKVPGKFGDQVEIALEQAVILQMKEGVPEPELKDDKLTYWMPYKIPEGKEEPNKQTMFVRSFCKSAEALLVARGHKPEEKLGWQELVGKTVTMARQPIIYKIKNKETGEVEESTYNKLCFIENEDEKPEDMEARLKAILLGKTKPAALKAMLTDARARRESGYKDMLVNDPAGLAQKLGLEFVDDKFTEPAPKPNGKKKNGNGGKKVDS